MRVQVCVYCAAETIAKFLQYKKKKTVALFCKQICHKKKKSIISHCHQFFESDKKLESQILAQIFKQCVSFRFSVHRLAQKTISEHERVRLCERVCARACEEVRESVCACV